LWKDASSKVKPVFHSTWRWRFWEGKGGAESSGTLFGYGLHNKLFFFLGIAHYLRGMGMTNMLRICIALAVFFSFLFICLVLAVACSKRACYESITGVLTA
jgi:hypothetical protein